MISRLLNWPGDYTSASATVAGTLDNRDFSGSGDIADWSITETWDRARFIPSGTVSRFRDHVSQLDPVTFLISCYTPTRYQPALTYHSHDLITDDTGQIVNYNPALVSCGSFTRYAAGVEIDTGALYGIITGMDLIPRDRFALVDDDDPPEQTVTIGTALDSDHNPNPERAATLEQVITAGAADSLLVMLGAVELQWIDPGGKEFHFNLVWSGMGHPTINTTGTPPIWDDWAPDVDYHKGDVVNNSDSGIPFECIKDNTSEAGQDISALPLLWELFDVFNSIIVTKVKNGVDLSFQGRYLDTTVSFVENVSGTVYGRTRADTVDKTSVSFQLFTKYTDSGNDYYQLYTGYEISGATTNQDPSFGDWQTDATFTDDTSDQTMAFTLA